jgi:type II secretory pathway component PulM
MIPEWRTIGHLVEIYGLLSVAGTCLLYAFVLHVKVRNLARLIRDEREHFNSCMERWTENVESLRAEVSAETIRPAAGQQALNLNKRGQVLRMRRRGENPETIAAALAIPRNEVDLLLKVHQLAIEQVDGAVVM